MSATTTDLFLGGRLRIEQPKDGYRAGADPVFLAAAVPVRSGETVLELGCGSGVAMLCLLARVPEAVVTGLERDPEAAELARANVLSNGVAADIVTGDLSEMPAELRETSFHHVMMNPPYFDRNAGSAADGQGREAGRGIETPLAHWADAAIRRLKPGGTLTLINRAEGLPEWLSLVAERVGDVAVRPLAPRAGKPAKLFVSQGRKGGKGAFRLAPPLTLHSGERHEKDGDSYTPEASAILRQSAPLTLIP